MGSRQTPLFTGFSAAGQQEVGLVIHIQFRSGRLFWIGSRDSRVAKIYLKMPQNQIFRIRNRCAAGFPVFAFFWKCPRFICPKYIVYRGLLSKKKSWSHGTTLGRPGGPLSRGFIQKKFCFFFHAQNMPKWHKFKG